MATEETTAARGNGKPDGEEEALLDLSTLVERPVVNIKTREHPDGKLYELAAHQDFGIIEQHQLKSDGEAFDKLWEKDELNSKERQRLKQLLDRMFEKVLLAPKEVKEQIGDGQRSAIVRVFTFAPEIKAAREQQRQQAQEEGKSDDPSTTES